jgi:putative ABC transport system substrate-binding protein
MKRRSFTVASSLLPFAAWAQTPQRKLRIGSLSLGTPESHGAMLAQFRDGLASLGYREGVNLEILYRWAAGQVSRLPELAADLASQRVDVFLTSAPSATRAVMTVAPTTPVVMATGSDPVGNGLVASLHSPGGYVTGLSNQAEGLLQKMLETLALALPATTHVAALMNPSNLTYATFRKDLVAASALLKVKVSIIDAVSPEDLAAAFAQAKAAATDALLVQPDPVFVGATTRIVGLANAARLPGIYALREFTTAGGLMSYGQSLSDSYRRAASFVDKIARGARPSDLPVEQPSRFELVVNLATARSLGVSISPIILARADEVIE